MKDNKLMQAVSINISIFYIDNSTLVQQTLDWDVYYCVHHVYAMLQVYICITGMILHGVMAILVSYNIKLKLRTLLPALER